MPSSAPHHEKSRCVQYPGSIVKRFPVPDDKVDWSQSWPEYDPVCYTAPSVLKKPVWADPDIGWATLSLGTFCKGNILIDWERCILHAIWEMDSQKGTGIYWFKNILRDSHNCLILSNNFWWCPLVLQFFLSSVQCCRWSGGQDKLWGQLQSGKWKAPVSCLVHKEIVLGYVSLTNNTFSLFSLLSFRFL